MSPTVTLYRPIGPEEFKLIRESGYRRFPPRLPEQPIFYPVVQQDYARKIARDWNVNASGAGYVTRFLVRAEYIRNFEAHVAGGSEHAEYWIPSDQLDEFNDNIVGRIEVIEEFHSSDWRVVYDLAQDEETIRLVQNATVRTSDFGVVPEVALFGSDEWWRAIQDGRIQKHEVVGTISRVYMTGHGDWPEFEVDCDGVKTRWTRVGEQSAYAEGKEVRVEYIMQKLRRDLPGHGARPQVLRVLIKA